MTKPHGRTGQAGVPKGPYEPRRTTQAMIDGARARVHHRHVVDAMLAGQRRARDAKLRAQQAEDEAKMQALAAIPSAVAVYRTEKARKAVKDAVVMVEARAAWERALAALAAQKRGGRPRRKPV